MRFQVNIVWKLREISFNMPLIYVSFSNRCLASFGIYPSRTYGVDGKLRFHSDNPMSLIDGDKVLKEISYFTWEDVAVGNPNVSIFILLLSGDE